MIPNPSAIFLGRSLAQQKDIEALLLSFSRFEPVFIFSEFRGVTEADVDAALGAGRSRRPRGTELPGLVIIVAQPTEGPDPKTNNALTCRRRHLIRIIEVAKINQASGGTKIDCDTAKDLVKIRLDQRYLGRDQLTWAGTEPWTDAKGGYGYTIAFDILDDLPGETRGPEPIISFAGGLCTLATTGYAGTTIYYTVDGTLPYAPHPEWNADGPNSGAIVYAAPFAVDSGMTIRAVSVLDGSEISGVSEEVAP